MCFGMVNQRIVESFAEDGVLASAVFKFLLVFEKSGAAFFFFFFVCVF